MKSCQLGNQSRKLKKAKKYSGQNKIGLTMIYKTIFYRKLKIEQPKGHYTRKNTPLKPFVATLDSSLGNIMASIQKHKGHQTIKNPTKTVRYHSRFIIRKYHGVNINSDTVRIKYPNIYLCQYAPSIY